MAEEIGYTGLKQNRGVVMEEFQRELQGDKGVKVYREMRDNDALIHSMLFAIEMLLRRIEWRVDGESEWAVEFVESLLSDMTEPWSDHIAEALSFLQYGWSYFEIVYKRRTDQTSRYPDGFIGWEKFAPRSQDTLDHWEIDDKGNIFGLYQRTDFGQQVYIPLEKALHYRASRQKNNPEGRSVLRGAYRAWWYKKRIEEIEAIGIERDLAGIPVIGVPYEVLDPNAPNEVQATRRTFEEMGRNLRNDEQAYVMMPRVFNETGQLMYSLDLLSTQGSRQFETSVVVARWGQQMTMTALTDFILLGHEKVGSFALASTKSEMLTAALQAWMSEIADIHNSHSIPRLWKLNGFDIAEMPRLRPSKVETVDIAEFTAGILRLSQAGMMLFPDPTLEQHIREQLSLPAATPTLLDMQTSDMQQLQDMTYEQQDTSQPDAPSDTQTEDPLLKAETFTPPQGVQEEAKRALAWIADGKAGGGFTSVGRRRASQLANGNAVSLDTIKRMHSFLARHEVDKQGQGFSPGEDGYPSGGRVAWAAWGGDPALSWVKSILRRFD